MMKLKELDREYIKTNNEIDKLENELSELKDHKVRLRFFYNRYYKTKNRNEVLNSWVTNQT